MKKGRFDLMKKLAFVFALLLLFSSFSGCGEAYSTSDELYAHGIKLVETMNELIASENYSLLYGMSAEVVDAAGFSPVTNPSEPAHVYSVTLPEMHVMFDKLMYSNTSWEELSAAEQEQVTNKTSFMTLVSSANSKLLASVFDSLSSVYQPDFSSAPTFLALASIYQTVIKNDEITPEGEVNYVYVYENGTAVAVGFMKGSCVGMRLFINEASDVEAFFGEYGCTVEELDIK